jgi:hypothetical protein
MAHSRSSVAAILVATAALAVATAGPGLAKSSKPPFKAGRYGGTVTSNVSGHEPASRSAKLKISKVGKGYRLRMTLSVRVTCNNKGHWRKLPFRAVHVDKTNGLFSGRTSRRYKAWKGTVSGQAAGSNITATWNYLVPDGSCWGNGNVNAARG